MIKIYAVENVITFRVYVGIVTRSLNRRLNEHRSRMRKGLHEVSDMNLDFELHGSQSFQIRVLEEIPDDSVLAVKRETELKWMRHFQALGRLYNQQLISFQLGAGHKLRSHTPEANEKRRLAQLGRPKRPGHGAKISATKKALGQRPTLEAASMGGKESTRIRWKKD